MTPEEEAKKLLPCTHVTRFCDPKFEEECYGCLHRPTVAAALTALRAENDALRNEISKLNAQLAAEQAARQDAADIGHERIVALEAQLADLRAEVERHKIQRQKEWEQVVILRAELAEANKAAETYKRIADRNHQANMMPCPSCGYKQAEIKAALAKEQPKP